MEATQIEAELAKIRIIRDRVTKQKDYGKKKSKLEWYEKLYAAEVDAYWK